MRGRCKACSPVLKLCWALHVQCNARLACDSFSAFLAGAIDRAKLSQAVLDDENVTRMAALEAIVHPLVAEARDAFISEVRPGRLQVAPGSVPHCFAIMAGCESTGQLCRRQEKGIPCCSLMYLSCLRRT